MGEFLSSSAMNEALKEGRIRGYRCANCGHKQVDLLVFCPKCGKDNLDVVEFDGVGGVVTYTIQQVATDTFQKETPYAWVIVELDGGVRVTGWMPSIRSPEELALGQRVRLTKTDRPGMVFEKVSI